MSKEIFLLERLDDTMPENSFQKLDHNTAEKLVAEGKAFDANDIQRIREIDKAADNLVNAYKSTIEYLRTTDDPRIANITGAREYEMRKVKEDFEKEIKELERLKAAEIEKFYEEAMRQKANAIRSIPQSDKEAGKILIEQLANEAKYGDMTSALHELSEQISYMSPARKKAVAIEFSRFADAVEQNIESLASETQKQALKRQLREIYSQLTNIHDPALIKAKMAEALKAQGATFTSYRILKLTHRTYK
jgi:hypothetical protein